jgi:transcriptional regulator with XRE-family HTH domain
MVLSRLKERREARTLTQMELAQLSGVGRATIAAIETGKRIRVHPTTVERLARALKVRPERLGVRKDGTTRKAEAQDPGRAAAGTRA